MGIRDFNADLSRAQVTIIDGITDLRRGESDGHLVFLYRNSHLPQPIEIQVLSQDVSSYPKHSGYLVFVSSDGLDSALVDFIRMLSRQINGKPIKLVLETICKRLAAHLDPAVVSQPTSSDGIEDAVMDDAPPSPEENADDELNTSSNSDFDDADYEWDDDLLSNDDPEFEAIRDRDTTERVTLAAPSDPTSSIYRQKRDFRAAVQAGFSVGFYESSYNLLGRLCSISVPVAHLGVSEEIMEAWHLAPGDNLVLLLRLPQDYPTAASYLRSNELDGLIQFELGKSRNTKPSLTAARAAFAKASSENPESRLEDADDFVPLYLFNSVPKVLGKDLPRLLTARRDEGLSWIEAQEQIQSLRTWGKPKEQMGTKGAKDSSTKSTINSKTAMPDLLQQDHALEPLDNLNIPLVAMECCLCLIVNCGTYCVNCHGRMSPGYQTMRPYVCNRDLCLDHYFSLGLGPGIEHEIINSPYVVDLLVSFFYVAIHTKKLRWFPRSLRLKLPAPEPDISTLLEAGIDLNGRCGELTTNVTEWKGTIPRLSEGERVILFVKEEARPPSSTAAPTLRPGLRKYLCLIDSVEGQRFTFQILAVWEGALRLPNRPRSPEPGAAKSTKMYLQRYTSDLDDLDENQRNHALLTMLCGIPSVLQLRQHLVDHPGQRLSQSHGLLDRHTYRLLFWIVSSNRSLVVQDESIKNPPAEIEPYGNSTTQDASSGANQNPNKILGLSDGWMQFRFVQGSPEKERRFVHEINKVGESKTPTLFAWHGSALGNWHGIVSEGLNYQQTANGRAYGNGVYFSPQFYSSLSYSQQQTDRNGGHNDNNAWLYSELQIEQAISMCEIANFPEKFVSRTPHYVVNNLDWIQCRFLFVRYRPTPAALQLPFPNPSTRAWRGYLGQDTQLSLTGLNNCRVEIPASAIPPRGRDTTQNSQSITSSVGASVKLNKDTSTKTPQGQDIDGVLGNDPQVSMKKRRLGGPKTDFVPETLDWDSLPKLPEPTASSASSSAARTLTRELKEMHKIQENEIQEKGDLAELGWHIDVERVTNLLHWIVELHTFDPSLPTAQDMKKKGVTSIVLELRMGENYPLTPPFVRVIRPRFLPFQRGGGGHVTTGGAICSELLTNSGWLPSLGIEKVLLQVKLGLQEKDQPARLDPHIESQSGSDYGILAAVEAYKRAAQTHGWSVPADLDKMVMSWGGH